MAGFALTTKNGARSAAFGIAAAAALFSSAPAYAGDFTYDQCRLIAATSGTVVKKIGKDNLSVEFRKSLMNFIMPSKDGAAREMTCDGPKNILTPSNSDVVAFSTIQDVLTSKADGGSIDLYKAGIRSVDPKDVAMREQRRSEFPAPRPGG